MTPIGTNRQTAGRVAAFLFLVVVAANAATFPFIGAGPWWTSPRFWLGRVGILLTAVAGAWVYSGAGTPAESPAARKLRG